MSQYLILSRIKVQNANCIAGFTWGFPAVTNFLGFTHALQRQLSKNYDISFNGCAVVSHNYQLRVYKPNPRANFEFIQSKNPPVLANHKAASPPIIEEGKMNLTTSIIIEVSKEKELLATDEKLKKFKQTILELCLKSRLAGGTILSIGRVDLLSSSSDEQQKELNKKIKRLTMPGFVLKDRSDYLKTYFNQLKETSPNAQLLDAWLDFSAMKYQAQPQLKDKETQATLETDAEWERVPKPKKGWLVPLMTGYKAISECYPAGEVGNSRDTTSPTRFVEAIHSIGEWKSMHRTTDIGEMIWKYHYENEWYLCTQNTSKTSTQGLAITETENLNFETAIANL